MLDSSLRTAVAEITLMSTWGISEVQKVLGRVLLVLGRVL